MVKIDSYDKTLEGLFQDFYTVPDFQREYVWTDKQVTQLLEDINEEYTGTETASEYFIGSIVVCKNEEGNWAIIDGQQRISTLFIIFCTIRDRLYTITNLIDQGVEKRLKDIDTDPQTGKPIDRLRLILQYEESEGVLEKIAASQMEDITENSESITNLLNAYKTAKEFLSDNFKTEGELRKFYLYLLKNVKVIRVETRDVTHALKVFETVNDRGIGLNPMDLLKNLMFIKTDKKDYQYLKREWKEITSILETIDEKPLRFLRYFILASYETGTDERRNIKVIREDEIYEWFKDNDEQCQYTASPREFVKTLKKAADDYAQFIQGKNDDGSNNPYLENINLLSGVARQHVILLLAGRHLNKDNFQKLSHLMENLFFSYIITRKPTKEFERNFTIWASELRRTTDDTVANFFEDRLEKEINQKSIELQNKFKILSEDDLQTYRVRYILAKLTQFIEQAARGLQSDNQKLNTYINPDIEIEHVFSKNPKDIPTEFADKEEYDTFKHRLGNLMLLEKTINASIGHADYADKKEGYMHSKFILTQSLVQNVSFGKDTRMSRASKLLKQYEIWNKTNLVDRQNLLADLALMVWGT